MTARAPRKFPIGIQNFATIRGEQMVYVDKIALIYELAQNPYTYFLSLTPTPLALMGLEKDWTVYPVIRLDLSRVSASSDEKLEEGLKSMLYNEFHRHGLTLRADCVNSELMFGNLITQLHLCDLDGREVTDNQSGDIYSSKDPVSLFYQTGYLTIKEADFPFYTLGFPNAEVKQTLLTYLVPTFMGLNEQETEMSVTVLKVKRYFDNGDVDAVMCLLQSLLGSVPSYLWDYDDKEKTYHRLVHVFFMMAGVATQSERAVSGGRIDMVCQRSQRVFIFEFKLDRPAEESLAQIDEKGYPLAWRADDRAVYKIGVSFSSTKRNITSWLVSSSLTPENEIEEVWAFLRNFVAKITRVLAKKTDYSPFFRHIHLLPHIIFLCLA